MSKNKKKKRLLIEVKNVKRHSACGYTPKVRDFLARCATEYWEAVIEQRVKYSYLVKFLTNLQDSFFLEHHRVSETII